MFVDGVSAKDVDQGRLGNCWFVASVACIAQDPLLLNKVCCWAEHFLKYIGNTLNLLDLNCCYYIPYFNP